MTTLRSIKNRIENISEVENGAKYVLNGTASGEVYSALRSFIVATKRHYSQATIEVEGQLSLDILSEEFPSEIERAGKTSFSLRLDKKRVESFPIVSINSFIANYRESFSKGNSLFGFINNCFSDPILVDYELHLAKKISSADEAIKIDIFSKAVNFVPRENIKIVPSLVKLEDVIADGDADLGKIKTFYRSLLNAYSFMYLCSSVELKENKLILKIDGYKEVECEITSSAIESKFDKMSVYNDLINWVFNESHSGELQIRDSKQLFLERLGIMRNVISLEIKSLAEDKDGLYKVTYSLLNKCKSSYNVFLKSKTKEYFDLRMKLEEHVEKLIRNLSEESTAFVNSFRNNMYIFISLVFSTLLLTYSRNVGSKGFDDFIAREDVGFVIMGYSVLNVVFLFMSSFRLFAANNAIILDKNNFKARYNKILDKGDTEDIVESSFAIRIKHNRVFFWIIIVLWLAICYVLFLNQVIYSYFKVF